LPRDSSRSIIPILAFLTPFTVRLIPEVLAWPYPIGFDTIYAYVPWIEPDISSTSIYSQCLRVLGYFHYSHY